MQKRIFNKENIIILLIFFSNTLYSASAEYKNKAAPKKMYSWMLIPVSARGAGIGQGIVAIVNNANTVFWNPGGIAFLEDNICVSYSYNPLLNPLSKNWLWNDEFHNLAFNTKISKNIITGLNYKYFSYGYSFVKDYSIGILFNYKKGDIGFGINTNLYSLYYAQNNPVLSFDFGVLYSKDLNRNTLSYIKNISFGISILNISSGVDYSTGHFKRALPFNLRIGYSITLIYAKENNEKHPFVITHNMEYSDVLNSDKAFYRSDTGGGIEFQFYRLLCIRLGYHRRGYSDSSIKGITYGTGFIFPLKYIFNNLKMSITYDFALYPWMPVLNWKKDEYYSIHSFGLKYRF